MSYCKRNVIYYFNYKLGDLTNIPLEFYVTGEYNYCEIHLYLPNYESKYIDIKQKIQTFEKTAVMKLINKVCFDHFGY